MDCVHQNLGLILTTSSQIECCNLPPIFRADLLTCNPVPDKVMEHLKANAWYKLRPRSNRDVYLYTHCTQSTSVSKSDSRAANQYLPGLQWIFQSVSKHPSAFNMRDIFARHPIIQNFLHSKQNSARQHAQLPGHNQFMIAANVITTVGVRTLQVILNCYVRISRNRTLYSHSQHRLISISQHYRLSPVNELWGSKEQLTEGPYPITVHSASLLAMVGTDQSAMQTSTPYSSFISFNEAADQ